MQPAEIDRIVARAAEIIALPIPAVSWEQALVYAEEVGIPPHTMEQARREIKEKDKRETEDARLLAQARLADTEEIGSLAGPGFAAMCVAVLISGLMGAWGWMAGFGVFGALFALPLIRWAKACNRFGVDAVREAWSDHYRDG
jgi:hypothetical protein